MFAEDHRSMGEDAAKTRQLRDILSLEQKKVEKIYTIQSRLVELFFLFDINKIGIIAKMIFFVLFFSHNFNSSVSQLLLIRKVIIQVN